MKAAQPKNQIALENLRNGGRKNRSKIEAINLLKYIEMRESKAQRLAHAKPKSKHLDRADKWCVMYLTYQRFVYRTYPL